MNTFFLKGVIASTEEGKYLGNQSFVTSDQLRDFVVANANSEEIKVVIDSPGGSVEEGFAMYEALLMHPGKVVTKAIRANSIASVVFLAGQDREVVPGAELMIHNAWFDPSALDGQQLNTHSLGELKEMMDQIDAKILGVYTEKVGKDKTTMLMALMASETNLGAEKAIELGFATAIVEDKMLVPTQGKILTFNKLTLEKFNLEKEMENEKLSALEKVVQGIKNLLKGSVKNLIVQLADGAEVYVYTEDDELVGKSAVLAEDGMPTESPAPAGEHVLADGRTITVGEGGVIEAIADAPASEIEAKLLEKEEELAKAEKDKEELKDIVSNLSAKNEALEKELKNVVVEFGKFKNQISGDPESKKKTPAPEVSKEEYSKLSKSEQIRQTVLNKAKNLK
jgi:ATP-dependent protease ClpP protease subunit